MLSLTTASARRVPITGTHCLACPLTTLWSWSVATEKAGERTSLLLLRPATLILAACLLPPAARPGLARTAAASQNCKRMRHIKVLNRRKQQASASLGTEGASEASVVTHPEPALRSPQPVASCPWLRASTGDYPPSLVTHTLMVDSELMNYDLLQTFMV